MASPRIEAIVMPVCQRYPGESDEAVEILADAKTPLRMVLLNYGFRAGQRVRIEVVEDEEPDPFESP